MRIVIGYPSLDDSRGYVQVGQNRQSKIFSVGEEAAIFPCVMAWAATLLKQAGHEVSWQDGPTQGLTWDQQLTDLRDARPDLVCWEIKTPSAKRCYEAVRRLKEALPDTIVVIVGDHATALPEEVAEACGAYVLPGGDYDFALRSFISARAISHGWGALVQPYPTDTKLDTLPVIDRELCHWRDYSRMGNYLRRPGTHIYSARDCWWRARPTIDGAGNVISPEQNVLGGCTFCSWTSTFPNYRRMSVDQFMAEVESCHALGAREVFDDAGTWAPPGPWFEAACAALRAHNRGRTWLGARTVLGCNDRPGARSREHYRVMAAAGFRFILYGLESANLDTLTRINKGQKAEDMRNAAKWASEAGLHPHLTVMFGYPWETGEDADRTVGLVQELFDRGWANSMQATLLMPYPGTALFRQAEENGWLLTRDWDRYTMNECILTCPMTHAEVLEKIRDCYKAAVTPRYLMRKVFSVRSRDDLRFFWNGFKFWWGHLTDFGPLNSRRP